MNQFYDKWKCKCNEKISVTKKRKSRKRSKEKTLLYPHFEESFFQTFHIKYEKKLSSVTKILLNSLQKKYFYYAIDDILYVLKFNSTERDNILAILYSPVISLQNNLFINFFDIWIYEIYINEVSKTNKFMINNYQNVEPFNSITIKLLYKTTILTKKQKSLW